jgi:hypothetical protein
MHVPSPWAAPWLLQVALLLNWQLAPENPLLHVQVPLGCAVPLPVHVVLLLYWQLGPV